MKKFFLASFVLCSAISGYVSANDLELKRNAKKLIQSAGYKCDTVDKVNQFLMGRGFTVYCNGFKYSYEMEDKGGRWVITPE
ncbi:hypothetical protein [Halomonas ventosae]|uniref:hypothetical protein n=1 Tax=Halomonas ventosae TaxID=229007 RepID=UPI0011B1F2AA|nr:hypothetical protein [Halomonas ventosae]